MAVEFRKEPPVLVSSVISCEDAEIFISRRLDGELSPDDAPLLDAHLKVCAICQGHLESWTSQTDEISGEFKGLWPNQAPQITVRPRAKRCRWVPLSMAASPVAAAIAFGVYCMFCGTPAEAPSKHVTQNLPPIPTAAPIIEVPHEEKKPATIPAITEVADVIVSEPDDVSPLIEPEEPKAKTAPVAVEASNPPIAPEVAVSAPVEHTFAMINETVAPKLIPNLSMQYRIAANGNFAEEAGRIEVLGNVLAGRAIIRITDIAGSVREIPQANIDSSLQPPLRETVKRFVSQCQLPEMRRRFEDVMRRLDAKPK